ncbi:hypothetical protein C7964_10758, partial [Loktanella sp. PT4BL]|uniref:beta strand repeat-containing protein n=1 Tax=Loktanella sp. PT4BL TaxID=2135611 RepID=UPI000D912CAA
TTAGITVTTDAGDDTVTAGSGNDNISTGAADDTIVMSTNLTADDTITGGDGNDTLTFQDNGGGTDDLDHVTLVETITLGNANTEVVTLDSLVAAGATLTVNGAALVGSTLNWNGSAELDGNFSITSGNGVDVITGGAGNDTIISGHGTDTLTLTAGSNVVNAGSSNDTVYAGTGNDNIDAGADNDLIVFNGTNTLTADDTVDGGGNADKVRVDVTAPISFTLDADFTNVETLELADQDADGFDVSITLASTFDNGVNLFIDASSFDNHIVEGAETLNLNASAVNNGESLSVLGGAANDTVFLGVGNDTVDLGAGNDRLKIDIDDLTSADVLTGDSETTADTLEFTTAGTIVDADFTNVIEFETLVLANGTNNVTLDLEAYNGGNGIVSVVGGTGSDTITTSPDDAARDSLTIDLRSGGADTVRVMNGGSVIVNDLVDTETGSSSVDQLGGTVLDGFFASYKAQNITTTTPLTDSESVSGDDTTVTVSDNDATISGDLRFTGTNTDTNSEWRTAGSDGLVEPGKSFVTIEGFTAGAGSGFDRLNLDWVTSGGTVVNMSGGAFFNNVTLNSTILSGATSGSVIEVSSATFQLSDYTNLESVAGLLSNNGAGNSLLQLADGNYSLVMYDDDGTGLISDAYIYNITVDQGDGLDFESNEPSTGNFSYDADSIELVAVLNSVQSDALTGNNFIA